MISIFFILLSISSLISCSPTSSSFPPIYVVSSLGRDCTEQQFSWGIDGNAPLPSTHWFRYRVAPLNWTVVVSPATLHQSGASLYTYTHRISLRKLRPNQRYEYQILKAFGATPTPGKHDVVHSGTFLTHDCRPDAWSPRIGVFADMGTLKYAYTYNKLYEQTKNQDFDVLALVGDMAYAWDGNGGQDGREFMQMMHSLTTPQNNTTARIPLMVVPGNAESEVFAGNFSDYRHFYTMPNWEEQDALYSSWDAGRAHFIMFDTEILFYDGDYDFNAKERFLKWLETDLRKANAKRAERPWIIAMGHRPLYSTWFQECGLKQNFTEQEVLRNYLEGIFFVGGVDMVFAGHMHNYERIGPVFQDARNPLGPLYITNGLAGCPEYISPFGLNADWLDVRSYEPGYVRLDVHNKTHVYAEYLATAQDQVIDSWWLERQPQHNNKRSAGAHKRVLGAPGPARRRPHAATVAPAQRVSRSHSAAPPPLEAAQRTTLVAFYNSAGGPTTWRNRHNWLVGDPCNNTWYGVQCEVVQRANGTAVSSVVGLRFPHNGLTGRIDVTAINWQHLRDLRVLDLLDHHLAGDVPQTVWHLRKLTKVILQSDRSRDLKSHVGLGGVLPDDLAFIMPDMEYLDLSYNQFTGWLPSSIGYWRHGHTIWVYDNQFYGWLPSSISHASWEEFYAHHNHFSCPYPHIGASYWLLDCNCPSGNGQCVHNKC